MNARLLNILLPYLTNENRRRLRLTSKEMNQLVRQLGTLASPKANKNKKNTPGAPTKRKRNNNNHGNVGGGRRLVF